MPIKLWNFCAGLFCVLASISGFFRHIRWTAFFFSSNDKFTSMTHDSQLLRSSKEFCFILVFVKWKSGKWREKREKKTVKGVAQHNRWQVLPLYRKAVTQHRNGIFFCMVCLQIAYEWGNCEDLWWSRTSNDTQCMWMRKSKNENNFGIKLAFQMKSMRQSKKYRFIFMENKMDRQQHESFWLCSHGHLRRGKHSNFNMTLKCGKRTALHFSLISTHSTATRDMLSKKKIPWSCKTFCRCCRYCCCHYAMSLKPTNNFAKLWP